MTHEELEQLIKDMKTLFEYHNHEEICYPIVRIYFMYKIGEVPKEDMGEYEKATLDDAYSILTEGRC